MVNKGDPAPDATARYSAGEQINQEISLSTAYEQSDKVVIYFFPAAFTGVCTKSSCELRDDIKEFANLGANIYGVSTDMPFSLQKFVEINDINYPVLSDWNKEMINAFDVVDNDFAGGLKGVAKRSVFVIDDNKITYQWIAEHPGKYPPFDEVKALLDS